MLVAGQLPDAIHIHTVMEGEASLLFLMTAWKRKFEGPTPKALASRVLHLAAGLVLRCRAAGPAGQPKLSTS